MKLEYHKLLSTVAFNFNLRRYSKSGLLLRAILRAAPVTKEFPLFAPDQSEVGRITLAFEWAFDQGKTNEWVFEQRGRGSHSSTILFKLSRFCH